MTHQKGLSLIATWTLTGIGGPTGSQYFRHTPNS